MAAPEAQMPFIRNLASSDRKLRTASLESLQTFIGSRKTLPETEALKLWKGLYYALWMTDRPAPQQALARELAELVFRLRDDASVATWLQAFWAVLGMQWTDIDVLRMDKFLYLVRRVFAAQIRWVKQKKYTSALDTVFQEWCFEKEGDMRLVPVGLRLHVLDLWVDELEKEEILQDEKAAEFIKKLGAMVDALRTCPVKPVRERVKESYEDERLPWGVTKEESEEEGDDDDEWGGIDG